MVATTTLAELFDTLTGCPACLAGVDPQYDDDPAHTCGDLDWTSLPTFGGTEPRDTVGVWSWDADNLLVGTCASDLRIEPRNGR